MTLNSIVRYEMEASKILWQHLIVLIKRYGSKWHNSGPFHIKRNIVTWSQSDQVCSRKNYPGYVPDENTTCDAEKQDNGICSLKESLEPLLVCKKFVSLSELENLQLPSEMEVAVTTAAIFTTVRREKFRRVRGGKKNLKPTFHSNATIKQQSD